MKSTVRALLVSGLCIGQCNGFAFVPKSSSLNVKNGSQLRMIDENVIMGAGIAIAGLGAGFALVSFTEQQGERAKERGSGLSENMNTQLSGMLMEDVEVSSVKDLGSLTNQLEAALKASGGADDKELELTEADKKRIQDEADDGW